MTIEERVELYKSLYKECKALEPVANTLAKGYKQADPRKRLELIRELDTELAEVYMVRIPVITCGVRERIKNDPDYTEISCNDEARMLGAGFSKPVGGRDHSKHIEELKRKYGGDEDPEYSDLDRKLIAKFRQ